MYFVCKTYCIHISATLAFKGQRALIKCCQ